MAFLAALFRKRVQQDQEKELISQNEMLSSQLESLARALRDIRSISESILDDTGERIFDKADFALRHYEDQ